MTGVLTGATLGRLSHGCRIIETKGESFRPFGAEARRRSPRRAGASTSEARNDRAAKPMDEAVPPR